jgi:hypothetical protein
MEHGQAETGTRRKQVFSIATPKASRSNPDTPNNAKKSAPNNLENYTLFEHFERLHNVFLVIKIDAQRLDRLELLLRQQFF